MTGCIDADDAAFDEGDAVRGYPAACHDYLPPLCRGMVKQMRENHGVCIHYTSVCWKKLCEEYAESGGEPDPAFVGVLDRHWRCVNARATYARWMVACVKARPQCERGARLGLRCVVYPVHSVSLNRRWYGVPMQVSDHEPLPPERAKRDAAQAACGATDRGRRKKPPAGFFTGMC